jgi:hypothetical protein
LDAAAEAIAGLEPAIRQQIQTAQQQINDASAAVSACHSEEHTNARTTLADRVAHRATAVEECNTSLEQLRAAEAEQCGIAEDCLCDEARVRTQDQEALCQSVTETYEATWCESHTACTDFHDCHAAETEVYGRLRSEVEAAMAIIVQEHIAVQQAQCLTDLIMSSMASGNPIPPAELVACSNVDVSALDLVFPDLPAEPAACPAPTHGNPECVVLSSPLTGTYTTSTQTGWGRDASVIQYGQIGLVGHWWHALEVTIAFPSAMTVTGVQTDYSDNSYNAFISTDGSTWTQVLTNVAGSQTLDSPVTAQFARLRWEDTHGTNGIHAQFLGRS